MTIEEAKAIAREHNEHIKNLEAVNEWFKAITEALEQ